MISFQQLLELVTERFCQRYKRQIDDIISAAACIGDRIFCQRYKRQIDYIISTAACIGDRTFL